jgi:hypothetical protein
MEPVELLTCHMVTATVLLNIPSTSFAGTLFRRVKNNFHRRCSCLLLFFLPLVTVDAVIKLPAGLAMMPFSFVVDASPETTAKTTHDGSIYSLLVDLARVAAGSQAPAEIVHRVQRCSRRQIVIASISLVSFRNAIIFTHR